MAKKRRTDALTKQLLTELARIARMPEGMSAVLDALNEAEPDKFREAVRAVKLKVGRTRKPDSLYEFLNERGLLAEREMKHWLDDALANGAFEPEEFDARYERLKRARRDYLAELYAMLPESKNKTP